MVLDRFHKPGRIHTSDDKGGAVQHSRGASHGAAGSAAVHVAELDVVLVALVVLELRELAEQQQQLAYVAVDPRARRPLRLELQVDAHVPVPRRHAAVVRGVQPVLHPAQDHLPRPQRISAELEGRVGSERGRVRGGDLGVVEDGVATDDEAAHEVRGALQHQRRPAHVQQPVHLPLRAQPSQRTRERKEDGRDAMA
eukprot:2417520-Rhodomonas_salina.1